MTWISVALWDMSTPLPRSFCNYSLNSLYRPVLACTITRPFINSSKTVFLSHYYDEEVFTSHLGDSRMKNSPRRVTAHGTRQVSANALQDSTVPVMNTTEPPAQIMSCRSINSSTPQLSLSILGDSVK